MNASEIFGLIIRCAGLALSLIGINRIYRALIMAVQVISITSFYASVVRHPCFVIRHLVPAWCPVADVIQLSQHKIKEK